MPVHVGYLFFMLAPFNKRSSEVHPIGRSSHSGIWKFGYQDIARWFENISRIGAKKVRYIANLIHTVDVSHCCVFETSNNEWCAFASLRIWETRANCLKLLDLFLLHLWSHSKALHIWSYRKSCSVSSPLHWVQTPVNWQQWKIGNTSIHIWRMFPSAPSRANERLRAQQPLDGYDGAPSNGLFREWKRGWNNWSWRPVERVRKKWEE